MLRINNILKHALRITGGRKVIWRPFDKRTQNDRGEFVNQYSANVEIYGSWQPVSNKESALMGMKASDVLNKLYVSSNVEVVANMTSPDLIIVDGHEYEVIETQDWYVDGKGNPGWKEVICSRKT